MIHQMYWFHTVIYVTISLLGEWQTVGIVYLFYLKKGISMSEIETAERIRDFFALEQAELQRKHLHQQEVSKSHDADHDEHVLDDADVQSAQGNDPDRGHNR